MCRVSAPRATAVFGWPATASFANGKTANGSPIWVPRHGAGTSSRTSWKLPPACWRAALSGDGLWLVFPDQTNTPALHFNHTNGLPSDWVISLWEDREKNLWCGTGAGLVVIRPNNLETVSPPDKWKSCPVLSVLPAPDGALWVGTEGAGLYRLQNGGWTNFNLGARHSQSLRLVAGRGRRGENLGRHVGRRIVRAEGRRV